MQAAVDIFKNRSTTGSKAEIICSEA